MDNIINGFGAFVFIYTIYVVLTYSFMTIISIYSHRKIYQLKKVEKEVHSIDAFFGKPVTILVPAYNEEAGIQESVKSLLSLNYPQSELIVINDGSTDQTKEIVIAAFRMKKVTRDINIRLEAENIVGVYQSEIHQNLWLVDKVNGGKADSLNAGINIARYPYICSIDGDTILDKNSLIRAMKVIIQSNGRVIATGGSIQLANGHAVSLGALKTQGISDKPLVVMQSLEYLRAFYVGRIALSMFNIVLIVSGAFSVFEKQAVFKVGGYSKGMIGEDMELVVKLHRYVKENKTNQRIEYLTDPLCWTEAPEDLATLRKQRRRWHQGLIDSLWKHRKVAFNPKYGEIGLLAFPYYILVEALGPIIEFGGYLFLIYAILTGSIYYEIAIIMAILFVLLGTLLTVLSLILEAWSNNSFPTAKDTLKIIFMSLTENLWFRPLTVIWRMEGVFRSLVGSTDWGEMNRKGLNELEKEGRQ